MSQKLAELLVKSNPNAGNLLKAAKLQRLKFRSLEPPPLEAGETFQGPRRPRAVPLSPAQQAAIHAKGKGPLR